MVIDLARENYIKGKEIEELKMDVAVLAALAKSWLEWHSKGWAAPPLPEIITVAMVKDIVDKWNFGEVNGS